MGGLYLVILTLSALGVGQVDGRVRARCLSFQDTMDTCLGPLGGSLGLRPGDDHELLSDLNTTKILCQEGKLQDSMTCLEEVFNDCAAASRSYGYHRQQQPSSLMLGNGNWRNSMERLCANIDYLQEHEKCSRVIAVESSHCIKKESKNFMDKSSLVLEKALRKGRTGHKQLMDLGCRFAKNVILCFQLALDRENSCPCRYRSLMVDIVMNSMHPFCKPDIDYYYYVYGDCEEDEQEDNIDVPNAGFSGSKPSMENAVASKPNKDNPKGSSLQKVDDGTPGEVVMVQKPQTAEKEGAYKVHDVGQSQEHVGSGFKVIVPTGAALLMSVWMAVLAVMFP